MVGKQVGTVKKRSLTERGIDHQEIVDVDAEFTRNLAERLVVRGDRERPPLDPRHNSSVLERPEVTRRAGDDAQHRLRVKFIVHEGFAHYCAV